MVGKRLVSTGSSISERINPSSGAKWVTGNGDGTIGYTTSENLTGSWSKPHKFLVLDASVFYGTEPLGW